MLLRKLICIALLAFLLPLGLWAQTAQDFNTRYQNARILLDQKKFGLAMAEFQPLTANHPNNKVAPEAMYFYSLAALKSNKLKESAQMLSELFNTYPDWPNIDEAKFLGANLAFRNKEYDKALQFLSLIEDRRMEPDVAAMKAEFLIAVPDKATFQSLLQKYPSDKGLAQIYADKLIAGWYTEQDKKTLEHLVAKFNLDKKRYANPQAPVKKEFYNVAILMPFQLPEEGTPIAANRKNQFITDFYAGMRIATDSLFDRNVKLNIFNYDAAADTQKVKQILQLPELKTMDLVIGPVYKSTSRIASRYAQENKLNLVNPMTQDLELAENNPYVFLFEASLTTQAREAAAYAYNNFESKKAIIVFDNTKEDTTFAGEYKRQFIKLGGKVAVFKKIDTKKTPNTTAIFTGLDLTEIGHVVVLSSSVNAAVNSISMLESKGTKTPLLTYASWLDITQLSLNQLDENEIYFIHPKYIDYSSKAVKRFKKVYTQRYNVPPSTFAYSGFEMMYYFGNLLQQNGRNFNASLPAAGISPGVFFPGIGYAKNQETGQYANDNQYVPIVKLDNLQLFVVNPPLR